MITTSMPSRPPSRACVIGHPIAHSRSPLIHGFWLAELGIAGTYERCDVAPAALPGFIGALARAGYRGCNITIPHKQAAVPLCTTLTETARAMGAVNTVWLNEDGLIVGDNTDGAGFVAHLEAIHPDWNEEPAAVVCLGAGGAARAIIYALIARKPKHLVIVNRSVDRASHLAAALRRHAEIHGVMLDVCAWQDMTAAVTGADLLINTTSLGMRGQPPLEAPVAALSRAAIVADIVYAPLKTDLLARAAAGGLRTLDGLGMLLHQAAPGFARWFGVRPSVSTALRAHIVADLERAE